MIVVKLFDDYGWVKVFIGFYWMIEVGVDLILFDVVVFVCEIGYLLVLFLFMMVVDVELILLLVVYDCVLVGWCDIVIDVDLMIYNV